MASPRGRGKGSGPRFSRPRRCHAPTLTASTIWRGTRVLSMWEPITTPPVLPWPRSEVGGATKAGDCIRKLARLLITADGGGSNGYRVRLWKWELQRLANQTGLEIAVCHFPPGHKQMEQSRTPPVLVYLFQLARRTVARLRNGGWLDCLHYHRQRTEGQLPTGPSPLPAGKKNHAGANGKHSFEAGALSRGMELCHLSR